MATWFADRPIRWKILGPYIALSVVFGASLTVALASSVSVRLNAQQTARLRDGEVLVREILQSGEHRLSASAHRLAHAEAVVEAIRRDDRDALRRLLFLHAVNAESSLAAITDVRGIPLAEVRMADSGASVNVGADWSQTPFFDGERSVVGRRDGEPSTAIVRRGGEWYITSATLVRGSPGEDPLGVALVSESLARVASDTAQLARAQVAFLDARGETMVGAPLTLRRLVPRAGRSEARLSGRAVDVVVASMEVDERRAGFFAVAVVPVPGPLSGARALVGVGVGTFAAVVTVGLVVAGQISVPLRGLLDATRRLREGRLSHRVAITTRDEVGELAASFNAMATALESAHSDLETHVLTRTRELRETLESLDGANAELVRANDLRVAFLGTMSHELRTPLSGLLISAEMLNDSDFRRRLSDAQVEELAGKMLRSGRHLLGLVDDILDLCRIESGRLDLHPAPVAVGSLLAELESSVRPIAQRKGVALDVRTREAWVIADPLRTSQVLVNLATNAVKFTPQGGRVWIDVEQSANEVRIGVSDNGTGIEPDDLSRIFEPFERGRRGAAHGAGMGLAISKRVAELQGGSLGVRSAPGAGSSFTLRLPRDGSSTGETVKDAPRAQPAAPGQKRS